MTKEQGFRLVTRALVVYFLFWVISDLVALPQDILPMARYWHRYVMAKQMNQFVSEETYWLRYYALRCCALIIEVTAWLWAAGWFYRGAPAIRRFFLEADTVGDATCGEPSVEAAAD